MCYGHPHTHPCSHTSIAWDYCASAPLDLATGYESPCADLSFAAAQPTAAGCPLQNCRFGSMGGSWQCCACGRGPNTRGWCTMPTARLRRDPETFEVEAVEATCDHGCCSNCTQYGKLPSWHFSLSLGRLRPACQLWLRWFVAVDGVLTERQGQAGLQPQISPSPTSSAHHGDTPAAEPRGTPTSPATRPRRRRPHRRLSRPRRAARRGTRLTWTTRPFPRRRGQGRRRERGRITEGDRAGTFGSCSRGRRKREPVTRTVANRPCEGRALYSGAIGNNARSTCIVETGGLETE